MTCDRCPYSLSCLAGELHPVKCRSCDRVVVTIVRGYWVDMYDPVSGHYQDYAPGHHALIRCPPVTHEDAFHAGLACPACRSNSLVLDNDEDTIEDLSEL